jgi:transaldolase
LYVQAFASPFTVDTMPENTLKALAKEERIGAAMKDDGIDAENMLKQLAGAGIDIVALAAQLQEDGAKAFVKSWNELMGVISSKSAVLEAAR